MSYCRFLEADVYVFMNTGGFLECCACILDPENWTSREFHSTQAMLNHLHEHRSAGHDVPDYVFEDIKADDKENFPDE